MANSRSRPTPQSGPPRSVVHPLPIQNFQLSKEHFTTDGGVKQFNILMQQVITSLQAVQGVAGPSVLPSGIDVAGAKVSGLAAPENASDAVSLGHAQNSYAPATQQQQLDIGAPYALKGLTGLYLKFNQAQAASPTYDGTNNFFTINGLMFQWGVTGNLGAGNTPVTISFNTPFPNASFGVLAIDNSVRVTAGNVSPIGATVISTSQFNINAQASNVTAFWASIGW